VIRGGKPALAVCVSEVVRSTTTAATPATQISDTLCVAGETTMTHIKRILSKLGLRDRAQAVVIAYETGLVTPGG
jgi:hypothetical protein